jgi:hypothetical protein
MDLAFAGTGEIVMRIAALIGFNIDPGEWRRST